MCLATAVRKEEKSTICWKKENINQNLTVFFVAASLEHPTDLRFESEMTSKHGIIQRYTKSKADSRIEKYLYAWDL